MLARGDTKVRGRFYEKRCGPSRRGARNASAVLKNFARQPEETFSTLSAKSGHQQLSTCSEATFAEGVKDRLGEPDHRREKVGSARQTRLGPAEGQRKVGTCGARAQTSRTIA
jgi:hypothetical protein